MASARSESAAVVNQAEAARLAGVSVTQVRNWHARGILTPRSSESTGARSRHLYAVDDVTAAKAWSEDAMWENEVVKALRVSAENLQRLVDAGRLPESELYNQRRVYSRSAVAREAARRERLISQREVARRFDLPYWVVRSFVDDGLLPFESGAKGAYLIDPLDLKPLLECRPCSVCGDLLRSGRKLHSHCASKTAEAREHISNARRDYFADPENRRNMSEKRRAWWQSDAAEALRAVLVTMPCPECEKDVTKRASAIKGDRTFCSKEHATLWRWRTGAGLDALIETMPGRVRQKYKGRWGGHKGKEHGVKGGQFGILGKEHGIESRFSNVGRPAKSTPEQKQRVLALDKKGRSQRDIARIIYGDERFRPRVQRILNG